MNQFEKRIEALIERLDPPGNLLLIVHANSNKDRREAISRARRCPHSPRPIIIHYDDGE
jgi:hypothetical protein